MSVRSVYQFSSLLRKCTTLSEISHARITHAQTLVNGFIINVTLQTDLLLAYSKCGLIQDARKVFDRMSDRNMHSWNIMIASYAQDSLYSDAISVFDEFRKLGFRPDHFTLPPLLKASAGVREVYVGKVLHGWVIRLGLEDYVVVGTSVLEFYLKCGDLVDARRVFNSMLWQDTVACNLMISGYAKAGLCAMAMSCFSNMIGKGVKMDSRTIPSILNACGGEGALMRGKEVHGNIVRSPFFSTDVVIGNSLINMYAKCGCLHDSEKVFRNMRQLDLVTWTTLISCYGVHGKGKTSLVLFKKMQERGFEPNCVTLNAVLASCSHSGLIDDARRIFNSMFLKYGFEPSIEHYACMVDLLGRFGHLEEALALVKNMKLAASASIWGALLAGCMMHRNADIGEIAAHYLFELEPRNSSNYIALCSIYESLGDRDGVSTMRSKMKELGLTKTPGCSWITIAGVIHKFYQGDCSHPLAQVIAEMLGQMITVLMLPDAFGRGNHI
ncbi:pentatricopeptide repeat-containing protein At3g24000, mitochondrial-like [Tripterygium wilfordii]|uniref:pentatricopeptide repeat-containing protein At3g24000, mitochondrial-like n=1 Tax=Tripterygium wilfordii TaxID=458696 RepID=UPI0018F8218E|nr:pentatricopeptide repeat-containing protein At3g24000, mitochondrial-like [Tripterygium wilfordii]XP_038707065.1 pentatricopeptide repeat-containing protein At3g24000, mitochondrial-like [Tripterygium wilfordii]